MIKSAGSVLLCSFLLIFNRAIVEGGFTFEMHLVHYENPGHLAVATTCCEEQDCTQCDNAFRFCVRERGSAGTTCSGSTGDSCGLGMIETRKVDNNNDDMHFNEGDQLGSRHTNPLQFMGDIWLGYVEVCWSAYDLDLSSRIDRYSDLVVRQIIQVPILMPGVLTEPIRYNTSYTSITMKFRLVCDQNNSLPDCSGPCVPMDNSTGHFTCDPVTGEPVCLPGYQGHMCTQCAPPSTCSEVGGYCTQPLECRCRDGYAGENCSLCQPATNCSEVGGYCKEPGECLCKDGYIGENCNLCHDCEPEPSSTPSLPSSPIVSMTKNPPVYSEEPSVEGVVTEPLLSGSNIVIMSVSGNVAILLIVVGAVVIFVLAIVNRRHSQRRHQSTLNTGAFYDTVQEKVDLKKSKKKKENDSTSSNDHIYETLGPYTVSPELRYGISDLSPTYAAVNATYGVVPESEVDVEKNVAYEATNSAANAETQITQNSAYAAVDREGVTVNSCLKMPLPIDPSKHTSS